MSFHNKIIALKYAGTLAAKVSGTADNKNWKKFNSWMFSYSIVPLFCKL